MVACRSDEGHPRHHPMWGTRACPRRAYRGPISCLSKRPEKEEVDLRLKRLEKPRGDRDGDIDFSVPSIQRQSIRTIS